MWLLGGAPILIVVLGTGMVAVGAAVSWIAFRTRGAFTLATALSAITLALGGIAWWRGLQTGERLAVVPFEIAAVTTIGAGLVIALGELARGRRRSGGNGGDGGEGGEGGEDGGGEGPEDPGPRA